MTLISLLLEDFFGICCYRIFLGIFIIWLKKSKETDKIFQTIELISNGADEIDMVMDYKALKGAYEEEDGDEQQSSYFNIEKEIKSIVNECHKNGVILKVIIECGELTLEQTTKAFYLTLAANLCQTRFIQVN